MSDKQAMQEAFNEFCEENNVDDNVDNFEIFKAGWEAHEAHNG